MAVAVTAAVSSIVFLMRDNAPVDERVVLGILVWGAVAFALAIINKMLRLGLLSQIAERVTFVLIPPLDLIFLVLGTIFIGVATPTRSEENTSELQSLMRSSYAVFCLQKKEIHKHEITHI